MPTGQRFHSRYIPAGAVLAAVVLVAALPGAARADRYLMATPGHAAVPVHEVFFEAGGRTRAVMMDAQVSRFDPAVRRVTGRSVAGEDIDCGLDRVRWLKIPDGRGDRCVYLRPDALYATGAWAPKGSVVGAMAQGGVALAFEGLSPVLDVAARRLAWGAGPTDGLAWDDLVWVELEGRGAQATGGATKLSGAIRRAETRDGRALALDHRVVQFDLGVRALIAADSTAVAPLDSVAVVVVGPRAAPRPVAAAPDEPFDLAAPPWLPVALGQRVRITGPGRDRAVGKVAALDEGAMVVALDSGESVTCPSDGAWNVAVSEGRHRKTKGGATIGAVIVGLGGLALGTAMAQDDFIDAGNEAIVGGLVAGALAGGIVGALFGSLVVSEEWSREQVLSPAGPVGADAAGGQQLAGRIGVRLRF